MMINDDLHPAPKAFVLYLLPKAAELITIRVIGSTLAVELGHCFLVDASLEHATFGNRS
jgi:hypothetical protein